MRGLGLGRRLVSLQTVVCGRCALNGFNPLQISTELAGSGCNSF